MNDEEIFSQSLKVQERNTEWITGSIRPFPARFDAVAADSLHVLFD